jgi:hypothetical protein
MITVMTTMARKGLWADFMEAFFVFVDWILTLRYLFYFSDASILQINFFPLPIQAVPLTLKYGGSNR